MIKHIVLWRMKAQEKNSRKKDMQLIKESLEGLIGKVPTLKSVEVGFNQNTLPAAYDLSLITTHATWEDLKAYQEHDAHKEVAAVIGSLTAEKAVSDYEL